MGCCMRRTISRVLLMAFGSCWAAAGRGRPLARRRAKACCSCLTTPARLNGSKPCLRLSPNPKWLASIRRPMDRSNLWGVGMTPGRFKKLWLPLTAFLLACALAGCGMQINPSSLNTSYIRMPFDRTNITFDDITYDARLGRVIVPAGETGTLALVDPQTKAVSLVPGFSAQTNSTTPVVGTTSAVTARGMIFALDRSAKKIMLLDPEAKKPVAVADLQGVPDYIRFVAASNELWVTERAQEQIETFKLSQDNPPKLDQPQVISVPNGPEALVIDRTRGLAFTNQPKVGTTAVIQVQTHNVIFNWGNGCSKARGMAIDEERGILFVACSEGKVVMMDILHNGDQIASQTYGGGLDFVAYNPKLGHLYLPSASSAI